MRKPEDRLFRKFQQTRRPELLGRVFDRTVDELWRVAIYLTSGDRGAAEDALQATFLTALSRTDDWRPDRPVLPWLLGVLANHVRKERRSAQRAATTPTFDDLAGPHGPLDDAQAREVTAAMQAAMQQLGPPYREVLFMHLQHGLTSTEIGEALDRKPATVRTQLARGLEQLRRSLPVGLVAGLAIVALSATARGALRETLLAKAATTTTAAAAVTSWSVTRAVAAAALLVGIGGVMAAVQWTGRADAPEPPPAATSPTSTPTAAEAASPAGRQRLDELATAPQQDPAGEASARAPDEVLVTVLRPDGQPAEGAVVGCQHGDREVFATTDGAGRVRFGDLPAPALATFSAVGTLATASLLEGPDHDGAPRQLTLRIEPGMQLHVRVVDASGAPVADAAVEGALGAQPGRIYSPLGRTNARGLLVLTAVHTDGQLRALARRHSPSRPVDVAGRVGEVLEVGLQLEPRGLCADVTVCTATGAPVPGAEVAIAFTQERTYPLPQYGSADERGGVTFDGLAPGRQTLVGRARLGDQRLIGLVDVDLATDGTPVRLVLRPGAVVHGTCSDDGTPVAAVGIRAERRAAGERAMPLLTREVRTDPDGSYRLDGLLPGLVLLRAFIGTEARQALDLTEGELARWDPVPPATRPLLVRLVDESGAPLGGWRVGRRQANNFPLGMQLTTGPDGRPERAAAFWLQRPEQIFGLELFAPRPAAAAGAEPFDPFPTVIVPPMPPGDDEYLIRVPDRARCNTSCAGHVTRPLGAAPGRVQLILTAPRAPGVDLRTWCDPRTGAFSFDHLSPGDYVLTAEAGQARARREVSLAAGRREDLGALALR